MYVKSKSFHGKELIKQFEATKYYCPHCKVLFKKNDKSYNLITPVNKNPYLCIDCNKYFNRNTYRKNNKNGKHYNFGENTEIIKRDIRKHISNVVTGFRQEGYLINDIHTITHFSEKLIKEVINDFKNENSQEYSFEEFIKILESDAEKEDYVLRGERNKRTYKIRKALNMGCSVSLVATIFKIGNKTIMKDIREQYHTLKDNCKNKLPKKLKETEDPIQREQIQREVNQIQKVLQNFDKEIARKRRVPRGRIEIDTEKKNITIKGIDPKQQKEFEKIILSPHTT